MQRRIPEPRLTSPRVEFGPPRPSPPVCPVSETVAVLDPRATCSQVFWFLPSNTVAPFFRRALLGQPRGDELPRSPPGMPDNTASTLHSPAAQRSQRVRNLLLEAALRPHRVTRVWSLHSLESLSLQRGCAPEPPVACCPPPDAPSVAMGPRSGG